MIHLIIGIFAATAMGGMFLVYLKRSGKGISLPAALGHGVFALAGLILLVYHIFTGEYTPFYGVSAALFIMAALGGLFLFFNHIQKKPMPDKIIAVHAVIATAAFLVLASSLVFQNCSKAYATLYDMEKEKIGYVCFEEQKDGVKISIEISKLSPGEHAFHIHGKGDFAIPEFKKAGGHFNPFDKEHGLDNPKGPHAGDLPNINVKEDGTYSGTYVSQRITLRKGEVNSILREGKTSIIIHKMADDNKTNPSGAAGPRIAGGIIK